MVEAMEPRMRDGGSLDVITKAPPGTGDFRVVRLGLEGQSAAGPRSKFQLASILASLRESGLFWCRRGGLRLVRQEIDSCYRRILWLRKIWPGRESLIFADIRESLPPIASGDSHTEKQPHILGIQALEKARPYLSLSDLELFLQGWFQAERWYAHMGTQCEKEALQCSCSSSRDCDSMPPQKGVS